MKRVIEYDLDLINEERVLESIKETLEQSLIEVKGKLNRMRVAKAKEKGQIFFMDM